MFQGTMRTAFSYVTMLEHEDKPNYNLVKLYLSFDAEDEERIFKSKLKIRNERMARDLLFDTDSNRRNS